ncbi:nuclear transport factor 2 family protein [Frankia sp. AgB1.9]|uniref:nuclear transport factor 2 family protein n=1 Tax=unclassified Frankia TaxID=2632575 RepID=UPI0019337604|nr:MULTISPECIES: nuclear transport factor 2 family protein [unclassified Frankia]MBL7489682.1 nuclear transport factor 2 family protein [Frankia sp. AgW1.1]MBL7550723.1 nuclear transport factor 2 family protein [Frankia sp. AgB1.9]MBL7624341.1 nuclear transport factor 2 family protein [Frankia sp. AgB1.8]
MDLQTLSDKLEIQEQLARYARGVDTNDFDLWKSVFTPDALIDYTSTSSTLPVSRRDDMAKYLEQGLGKMPMKIHYITNIEITLDGDTAKVIAQFFNPMQVHGMAEQSSCGGYYHHDFVRTPNGWKSKNLVEKLVWFINQPAAV